MRQFIRGERAKLSELAAINHLWNVGVMVDAPAFIVDFCCLGLDVNGQVVDDRFLISYNQPDAPQDAIRLANTSNNEAIFSLNLGRLPPGITRLVFTATLNQPEVPGGLLGAAFSLLGGIDTSLGAGQLMLGTPAIDCGFFPFSGADFGEASTLILGEFYWRDEWRFVGAAQPLRGELSAFLQTLTDGPVPFPNPVPATKPAPAAPPRPPKIAPAPALRSITIAPAPAPLPPKPSAPIVAPQRPTLPAPALTSRTAAPTAVAPPATTARPAAAPAIIAAPAPVFPPGLPPGKTLQDLIDAAAPGATLTLAPDEYEGPITISKPLILEGRDSALWARTGPVVSVAAPDVTLRNLDLEITVAKGAADASGVALHVEGGAPGLQLDNVRVAGRISGLGAEDGEWMLPVSLDLGVFAARADNDFRFSITVPTAVKLSSPVEGVSLVPAELSAGTHLVTLQVRDVAPETLLVGWVEVRSAALVRTVPLSGSAVGGLAPRQGIELSPLPLPLSPARAVPLAVPLQGIEKEFSEWMHQQSAG